MDRFYKKLEERINGLPLTVDGDWDENKICFTAPCIRPLLQKSMEHASEENDLSMGIFSPEMNLFRCFMRLVLQTASTDQERGFVQRFVLNHLLGYNFSYIYYEYVLIVENIKKIRRACLNEHKLKDTSFLVFQVHTDMMTSSLVHIVKKIDETLNVWDIGLSLEYIRYFRDKPIHNK